MTTQSSDTAPTPEAAADTSRKHVWMRGFYMIITAFLIGAAQSVLAKLTPTDFAALNPMELRRTRLAQVAAAFWLEGGGATVVCFASVAQYMFDLLSHAAAKGTEI